MESPGSLVPLAARGAKGYINSTPRWESNMLRSAKVLTLLALFSAACSAPDNLGPTYRTTSETADNHGQDSRGFGNITVMSRNLYVGADVDRVIGALATPDPADDIPALLGAVAVVQQTDFPTRARAIAKEIDRNRPDVVGLQEVSKLDLDLTPLGANVVIHQDFLAILLAELADRGLKYRVAATLKNTQASPIPGISLVDFDAVLISQGVELGSTIVAQNFSHNIGVVAPGINIIRGFIVIDAKLGGRHYTVANTHLESGTAAGLNLLRAAQAQELAAAVGDAAPAILLGDFNDSAGSPMHQTLLGAGFSDVWANLRPRAPGFTCCQFEDLSNPRPDLNQRIDFVFTRGTGTRRDPVKGEVHLTGNRARDKVPGPAFPIWPSDHAGIVATLITLPAWLASR
jgi:endonuclease/exonuclease/phosphatase family metal-dependent hydrolase